MPTKTIESSFKKRPPVLAPLSERYRQEWVLAELRRKFARQSYVLLPSLFSPEAFTLLRAEADRLEHLAPYKNFTMPLYQTPRVMKPLSGRVIMRESTLIPTLYIHCEIRYLVESIVGHKVYTCLDETEWAVINYLNAPGHTQGFHLDVPAFALVVLVYAPPAEQGGLLEFIQDWPDVCEAREVPPKGDVNPLVEECRTAGLLQARHHAAGDAYLLRADQCLHRVAPLITADARRVVLNMAFESVPDPERDDTAELLYE